MLVFVDESGDTGFRFDQGSSRYFTLVLVLFESKEDAAACDNCISQLKKSLRRSKEYRFSACKHRARIGFLEGVAQQQFTYSAIVLNKSQLFGGWRYHKSCVKLAMKYAFSHIADRLDRAKVVVDSNGDRHFRRTLKTYLEREVKPRGVQREPRKLIASVQSKPSHCDNLIQLADMICGAVAKSFEDEGRDTLVYRTLIRSHEEKVQFWPPKKMPAAYPTNAGTHTPVG